MIITFKTTVHKNTKNFSNSQVFDRVHCDRMNNIFLDWDSSIQSPWSFNKVKNHFVSNRLYLIVYKFVSNIYLEFSGTVS